MCAINSMRMINNFLSNTKIAIILARADNGAIFFAYWMQIVNRGINQFSQSDISRF